MSKNQKPFLSYLWFAWFRAVIPAPRRHIYLFHFAKRQKLANLLYLPRIAIPTISTLPLLSVPLLWLWRLRENWQVLYGNRTWMTKREFVCTQQFNVYKEWRLRPHFLKKCTSIGVLLNCNASIKGRRRGAVIYEHYNNNREISCCRLPVLLAVLTMLLEID